MKNKISLVLLSFLFVTVSCNKNYKLLDNWVYDTGNNIANVVFANKEFLFVTSGEYTSSGSPNHIIHCINKKTGKEKWKNDFGSGIVISDIKFTVNSIYIWDIEGERFCLNVISGELVSCTKDAEFLVIKGKQTYKGNQVISLPGKEFSKSPAKIICKNGNDDTLWEYKVKPVSRVKNPYDVTFSYLIDGDFLFVGTYEGKVLSLKID